MAVTREDVLHVARLARLRLGPDEVERITAQLSGILEHVEELNEVEVEGVAALGGVTDWEAPLRSEERGADGLERTPAELAPAWEAGFFTVPRLAALDAGEPGAPVEAASPSTTGPRPGADAGDRSSTKERGS